MKNNFYRSGGKIIEIALQEDGKFTMTQYTEEGRIISKVDDIASPDEESLLYHYEIQARKPFCSDTTIDKAKDRNNYRMSLDSVIARAQRAVEEDKKKASKGKNK